MKKTKYYYLDKYLKLLAEDIYPQPLDEKHTLATNQVIDNWVKPHLDEILNVLDVGCGQGNAYPKFRELNVDWFGLTLGKDDYNACHIHGWPVIRCDMSFTPYRDCRFDLIFARHVLEHSPMPLISLLEWHRIGRTYLIVVVPNPETVVVGGTNHYYMLTPPQWNVLFKNSGWYFEAQDFSDPEEFRFLLRKGKNRVDFYNHAIIQPLS